MSFCLSDFVHIRPRFEMDQKALLEWTAKIHAPLEDQHYTQIKEKLFQIGTGGDKIQKRGFQISDPFQENKQIYPVEILPQGAAFKQRMDFFDCEGTEIFEQFYPAEVPMPAHLIHVTCTGYVSPSPAQKIVSKRSPENTVVTHAYHMGCYASIPAIRIAAGALAFSSNSSADIVHTEMCSLHLHPTRHSTEQLIVQSLFADGFIKYTVCSQEEVKGAHLSILTLLEEIIPNTLNSMTWRCEDICHSMTLSKEIPVYITRFLKGYLERLSKKAGCTHLIETAYFAVHPGGSKIVQHIEDLLSLREEQLEHSRYVLQNYGNMSSATLPHIWERLLQDPSVPEGALIVSLAFGPGLSVTGGIFQKR